jgi:Na+/proline symporter
MVGAEWAFVQRFLCVPTEADARRSTRLFGLLYLASPLLWMLPPMLYRSINPNANPEQAYILACRSVLPAGMLGFVLAAMFSATASTVSAQLNVFAGVLTNDFYRGLFRPNASQRTLVRVGRVATLLLGAALVAIALCVPRMGGAENVILSITNMLVVPLLAPSIWGLFSRRIDHRSVWITALPSFGVSAVLTFGLTRDGWFGNIETLATVIDWLQSNSRSMEVVAGVILPVLILSLLEWRSRTESPGWQRITALTIRESDLSLPPPSRLPVLVVAWCVGLSGALIGLLTLLDRQHWRVQLVFAAGMLALAAVVYRRARRKFQS